MLGKPKLYVKLGNDPEVEVSNVINGLQFLGDSTSPNVLNTYQQNTGVDGKTLIASNFDKSTVNANFYLRFSDYYNLKLAKHEIYRLFSSRKSLRIRTDAEPAIVKYVVATPFDIAPTENFANDSQFTIPFDNPSGYKYSLARSDEINTNDVDIQMGMYLPTDQECAYHFTTTSFQIYNPSDIAIEPYEQKHDLKIIVKFSGDSIKLTNNTNETEWSYNKAASKSDTIILNGVNTTLNGNAASVNTDYGNITLNTGWNSISVTGATDIDITFSFPFVYIA
ncbi:phage tail domain-containing protein [Loigolactobacillus backii]|uniref:phage tail domain-containing protein n=1 Tax=Loigolactobacillus backii TaxID=375175 RepID=UPI0022FD81B5|nr:phage tail domain-containing protein [Loigolactobacillus backii]MDA5386530.1 phage tail family protein [Loigolactobacillus backii]MDA5389057.1 phage tail family protein [Loigolactobacillus backii]